METIYFNYVEGKLPPTKGYQNKTDAIQNASVLSEQCGRIVHTVKVCDDYTEITDYSTACKRLGIAEIDMDLLKEAGVSESQITYIKLSTIADAINGGKLSNWGDKAYCFYYPSFSVGTFDFLCVQCEFPSRASSIEYKAEKLARYAGQQFNDLYKKLYENI